ncbi:helix-turn-helix domain-containing GNAT family N-acetyltransferase [Ciceribacter sp. RN22]|uniref:bifunctional helix-turn-helix transcriptional regulator/GNAT family N-acetyltransferase n=1 Tax=Ciceribacter sp. RN22 TaxID=2954932 RepID=UPI0020923101|nr:helix-turn-helix domain-containing GNAT family N-acetyltransferase [Ciceribacter sp. RN22]MCO6178663.1 helix-turn-helix domain-containing GNAT family N-acetyltransferase [Ciceribacter sp. RN22]
MPDRRDLTTIDAVRAFNRFYTDRIGILDRAYLKANCTLAEARVIYELGARGRASAAELVRDLHFDPAYLSRILKAFRTRRLVEQTRDPADGRSQVITLTPDGMAEFEALANLSREQLATMLEELGPAERGTLVEAMATISRLLDGDRRNAAPPVVRPHRPGDLGWIVQSQAEFYTREFGWNDQFEALVSDVASKFLANFDAAKERCWIAERSGVRIGSVLVMNGGDGVAKLRLLYIDEAARGLGLGRLLVDQCIEFARRSGYRRMTLWTNDILHAARHIYVKAGFTLESEQRHTLFGPELNGQTWTLDL